MAGHFTFFWQFLTAYRTTGAIAPSSRRLSRQLARLCSERVEGRPLRVLEAGPGTGVATRQILAHFRPGDRLVIHELNPRFVAYLRHLFDTDPDFRRWRDAVTISQAGVEACTEADFDHAVCGIPFTNFDAPLTAAIFDAMWQRLRPGGTLSFFEYAAMRGLRALISGRATRARLRAVDEVTRGYEHRFGCGRELVLLNFPPAHACHCRRPAELVATPAGG